MMIIKSSVLFVFLGLINSVLFAQTERYEGVLQTENTSKYKSIVLSPKIRSIANSNLSDLRIFDKNKNQIPYFLKETHSINKLEFVPLKSSISNNNTNTNVLVFNSNRKLYNSFSFKVTNANVQKTCQVEGSNDLKKWFVVSERLRLELNNSYDKSYNFYTINFPSIDYDYIKLTVNDSIASPINIQEIGFFKNETSKEEIPYDKLDYTFELSQEEKTSQIHFTADRAYEINKIDFYISAPDIYNRYIVFYTKSKKNIKNKRPLIKKSIFRESILNSTQINSLKDISIKEKEFWIEVKNKDNQPLTIDSIRVYQHRQFIVAPIEKKQQYTLVAGDKKLDKPNYDIENFKNNIDSDLPIIRVKTEHIFKQNNKTQVKKISFYEKPWFMWFAIGLIVIIILFFTLSLLKEVDKT